MAKLAKLLSSASGSPSGLDVDEVFSTFVYTGDSSTDRDIDNGLDLSNEGGMIWFKTRGQVTDNSIFDTERGGDKRLVVNSNNDQYTSDWITFQDDGFKIRSSVTQVNFNNYTYVNWAFRKAPNFFDVVTYTGTGVNRTISHNLGSTPGMIIVKRTVGLSSNWAVYHRGLNGGTNPETKYINLNLTGGETANTGYWNDTAPTSSVFSVGANDATNANGSSYVAYLFAHNNGDGEFGSDADQDIIKCGTYTGAGTSGPTVNLGFEPQWLLIKENGTGDWYIFDTMRALSPSAEGYTDRALYPNLNNGEEARNYVNINQTGFRIESSVISSGGTQYLYMAIRNGPLKQPTSASDVFAIDTLGGTGGGVEPGFRSTFPVDMALRKTIVGSNENWFLGQRQIQGTSLRPNDITTLDQGESNFMFDYNNGWSVQANVNSDVYSWMWKRAPGYFDALYYSGNSSSARDITHNLGVVPEMIWVKDINGVDNWMVGTQSEGDAYTKLNDYDGFTSSTTRLRMTGNTATTFQVGNDTSVNSSSYNYVAYLFASISGVSKVGTYTGNGASQNIECGFSNGAKLIIIKSTGAASANWVFIDTERGLSNELYINLPSAQGTSSNVTSYSGGFALTNTSDVDKNANGTDYIFYAIAAP